MATQWADSCSFTDVQSAVNAAAEGDTVRVPSGSATWSSQLVLTTGISLIGEGVGSTVITSNYAGGYGDSDSRFIIVYKPAAPANDAAFRLSGFEFDMATKSSWLKLSNWSYANVITKVRIDHNKVYNLDNGGNYPFAIYNYGNCWGVADNNDFSGGYFRFFGMDANWTYLSYTFGTADNFYVEDNTIAVPAWSNIAYAERGARYCFRHNTISNGSATMPMFFDIHGNQTTSGTGAMGCEVYENTLNSTPSTTAQLNDQRGGKCIFFNNTINASGSAWTKIREDYIDSANPPANNVISGQPQHVSDSYYWGNKQNGTTEVGIYIPTPDGYPNTIYYDDLSRYVPQADKDVWGEDAAFDGSSGIGVGLLEDRPSSGLTVGVGYWATDESILYRATSATEWEEFYEPYQYPHALLGGTNTELTVNSASIALMADLTMPGSPAVFSASFTLAATSPTLVHNVPQTIMLGPEGSESTLPAINWSAGVHVSAPVTSSTYIDKVVLLDGSVRYNHRSFAPKRWTLEWASLSEADATAIRALMDYNVPLRYQNTWLNSTWHWVIFKAAQITPLRANRERGGQFYRVVIELEEVL